MRDANNDTIILIEHADRLWNAEQNHAEKLNSEKNFVFSAIAFFLGLNLFQIQWWRESHSAFSSDPKLQTVQGLVVSSLVFFAGALAFYVRLPRFLRGRTFYWNMLLGMLCRALADALSRVHPDARSRPKPIDEVIRGLGCSSEHYYQGTATELPKLPDVAVRSSEIMALPEDFMEKLPDSDESVSNVVFQRIYEAYLHLVLWNIKKKRRIAWSRRILFIAIFLNLVATAIYLVQIDRG